MGSVLIIYTGGTIGMIENPETGALEAVDFQSLYRHIPEVARFELELDVHSFANPIDSSYIQPEHWLMLVDVLEKNIHKYDGFVILHGTDTLAYTASALSYLIQNPGKPIILTGAQLPIGKLRTDGKENLITSIEIAAAKGKEGKPVVQEVAICFEDRLLRGSRSHKHSTEDFDAFHSFNYPNLANIGIHIEYNKWALYRSSESVHFDRKVSSDVALVRLFPGMHQGAVEAVFDSKAKAVVLETFGAGNAPNHEWFFDAMARFGKRGGILASVTQCQNGFVEQGRYQASERLVQLGVLSAGDMTTEAVLAKLMCLIGKSDDKEWIESEFCRPMAGDMTTYSERV